MDVARLSISTSQRYTQSILMQLLQGFDGGLRTTIDTQIIIILNTNSFLYGSNFVF